MNKLLTKIVGVALGATMAVGVGVAAVKASDGGMQRAEAGTATILLDSIGSTLGSTANTTMETVAITDSNSSDSYTLNYLQCKKQGNAMLMTKSVSPFISNHTEIPDEIQSVEVFINSGASGKTTYDVAFGTSEFTSAASGIGAVNITGGNSHVFENNVDGATYFCITLGNANNGQVLSIGIDYATSGTTYYSVTYNPNGATSGSVPTDGTSYTSGQQVTVLDNTGNLARTNYDFSGWNTAADGTGTSYVAGDHFNISANTTLYAKWSEHIEEGVDVLNKAFTGNPGSYTNWTGTGNSGAEYAGNSNGQNDSIQLRSDTSTSGIVTTKSAGYIEKVTVVWESHTTSGRTLNIYGKNNAYLGPEDLYGTSTQGTLLGTIVYGTSTEFTLVGQYRHIGLRSNNGAMYLTSVNIKWADAPTSPRVAVQPATIDLKTNQTAGIDVTGIVEDVENPTYAWTANNNNVVLENTSSRVVTIKPNTSVTESVSSTVTLTVGGVTPNLTATVSVTVAPAGPGETPETAYTIAQAKAAIDAGEGITNVYVKGYVSSVKGYYSSKYITYWLGTDGTADEFEVYNGLGINGASFKSVDDVQTGDYVIVFGNITEYNGTYEFSANSHLYSLERITYTVTYNANGGTGSVPVDSNEYSNGAEVTVLSGSSLIKDGYMFECWNTAADGSGTDYSEDDTFNISSDITLYAQWQQEQPGTGNVVWSRSGTTDTLTSGYTMVVTGSSKDGFYQDATSGFEIGFKKATAMWTTDCPTTLSLTAKVGGGSAKDPLVNNVYAYFLDSNYDLISDSETLVTSKTESTTGTNYTIEMPATNNVYGLVITHAKETSYNVRLFGLTFSYSTEEPSGASAYADLFLDLLSTGDDAVCDADGNTNLSSLVTAWGLLADEYDGLSEEDKTTLAGGTASESGDNIARALALYDYIGKKYNTRLQTQTLADYNFMSRSSASASNSINPINKVNNTVAIVVVVTISLVSVSALGAYFLLRKKKEER